MSALKDAPTIVTGATGSSFRRPQASKQLSPSREAALTDQESRLIALSWQPAPRLEAGRRRR